MYGIDEFLCEKGMDSRKVGRQISMKAVTPSREACANNEASRAVNHTAVVYFPLDPLL